MKSNSRPTKDLIVKRSSDYLIIISHVIRKAVGITSKNDLSRIEIIRDVPLGKGGGKKRAIIDFNAYLNDADATNNIRRFDGDILFFPKLSKSNQNQIQKYILTGLSPKFISVSIFGKVESTGIAKLPLEAALSDAINICGPTKPLFGKIVLIKVVKRCNNN